MATATQPTKKVVRRTPVEPEPEMPDMLKELIPPMHRYDEYVQRTVGGKKDIEILEKAGEMRHNSLIFGPTGPGKTSCIYAYAAKHKLPVYSVPCNGAIDAGELFGRMVQDENGIWHWQDGPVLLIMKFGGIIYLDEVNFMPPRIGAVFHSPLDKRRTVTILELGLTMKLHPKCQFTASYNPDYEGVINLNQAFRNRFAVKMEFDYDREIEKELVLSGLLLDIATSLRVMHAQGEISTPVSTNMLIELEEFADEEEGFGPDFAIANFLMAFPPDERQAVERVLLMNEDRLKLEIQGYDVEEEEAEEDDEERADDVPWEEVNV